MKKKYSKFYSLAALWVVAVYLGGNQNIHADNGDGKQVPFPFVIYDEQGSTNNHYSSSGWMGNTAGMKIDDGCTIQPHGGKSCLCFEYAAPGGWAGLVWQDPANDWGDQPGGWNLNGAKKLTFWARGKNGGETVTFKFGILGTDKKHPDSAAGELDAVKLTTEWKEYSFDLTGKDLTHIKTSFAWTLGGQGHPVTFYLDDIQYE